MDATAARRGYIALLPPPPSPAAAAAASPHAPAFLRKAWASSTPLPLWIHPRPRPRPATGFGVESEKWSWSGRVCGARGGASQPRGPLWKGRNISKEGVQAVQDLKRAGDDAHRLGRVFDTRIGRLLKADLLEVLNELQRQNEWLLALKVFQFIRKESWYKPDMFLYRKMMDNLGRNHQVEEVHKLFKESQEEGLKPDVVLFTELLGAYLRASMPQLALEIYEDMKSLGHEPNQLLYTILIKGLKKSGEFSLASSVLEEFSRAFPKEAGDFAILD